MNSLFKRIHLIFAITFLLLFVTMSVHHELGTSLVVEEVSSSKKAATLLVFVVLGAIIFALYLWLLKSLQPLKQLKERIIAMRDDAQSETEHTGDEIDQISREFDKTEQKIALLLSSRQLFLRTIIHEMNSPIGKARIIVEMLEPSKHKERLENLCEQMQKRIQEFVHVERVLSHTIATPQTEIVLSECLEHALESFVEQKSHIEIIKKADHAFKGEKELIAIALKNLIDNALRYGDTKYISIIIDENGIALSNPSSSLEAYFQEPLRPYHTNTHQKNHGLGLGLYVVEAILKMHSISFSYSHQNGISTFSLTF